MTQLTSPNGLREQARRLEQAAQKLKEAARVLEGIESAEIGQVSRKGGRRSKLEEIVDLLKQGPLSAKDVQAKMHISRGALYQWFRKRKDLFENKDGAWSLKASS